MKTINALKIFSALSLIALVSFSFSPNKINSDDEWTLIQIENGIAVSAKVETCGPGSWYIFKFENQTNEEITIEYSIAVKQSVAFGPAQGKILVKPNGIATGTCEDVYTYSLPHNKNERRSIKEAIEVELIKI